jgi:hypothetical protein
MLTADSEVEGNCLRIGNESRSIIKAAINVARRRDGGVSVSVTADPRRQSAFAAPPTPSGSCGPPRHWRSRTH